MKITNITELRAEKLALQEEAKTITAAMSNDFDVMKRSIQPAVLLHKAIVAIIPDALIRSKITGVPIDFILKAFFNHRSEPVKQDPAEEKKTRIKNTALRILESAAIVFLSKDLKKRV